MDNHAIEILFSQIGDDLKRIYKDLTIIKEELDTLKRLHDNNNNK